MHLDALLIKDDATIDAGKLQAAQEPPESESSTEEQQKQNGENKGTGGKPCVQRSYESGFVVWASSNSRRNSHTETKP